MRVYKPETTLYTVYKGSVVKCTVLEYFKKGVYAVAFPGDKQGFVEREKLFTDIDACIDDFQAFLMREYAKFELMKRKNGKEAQYEL